MANAARCTPAQVVFKIVETHGITPLSGTTNEIHMREGLDAEHIKLDHDADVVKHLTSVEEFVWGKS